MPTLKLTKTAIESARPEKSDYELRDSVVPGFLCKVTPNGRKVFMLSYRTVGGNRRKPAIGQFGELTVEQARTLAQEWQARVRAGGDPSLDKTRALCNSGSRAVRIVPGQARLAQTPIDPAGGNLASTCLAP